MLAVFFYSLFFLTNDYILLFICFPLIIWERNSEIALYTFHLVITLFFSITFSFISFPSHFVWWDFFCVRYIFIDVIKYHPYPKKNIFLFFLLICWELLHAPTWQIFIYTLAIFFCTAACSCYTLCSSTI